MYTLYTSPSPNGHKISILLEELKADYKLHILNREEGEHKSPEYLSLNPNGRIPTLVDHSKNDLAIMESGAIALYLAEKHHQFLPNTPEKKALVSPWVFFHASEYTPKFRELIVNGIFAEDCPPQIFKQYIKDIIQLTNIYEQQLENNTYLVDEYTIADILQYPFIGVAKTLGLIKDGQFPNIDKWYSNLSKREAVQKGSQQPAFPPAMIERLVSSFTKKRKEAGI